MIRHPIFYAYVITHMLCLCTVAQGMATHDTPRTPDLLAVDRVVDVPSADCAAREWVMRYGPASSSYIVYVPQGPRKSNYNGWYWWNWE